MKTQKKTLRGIVTSSIFALSLVTGLVPATALAYAAESAPQVINDLVQVAPGEQSTADEGVENANADAVQSDVASDANVGESFNAANPSDNGSASDSTNAPAQSEGAEQSEQGSAAPALPTSGYTTINPDRISATVALNAEETVVVGDVEYEGLTYRINEDGETATLIGFGTSKPSGNLVIPSRIATTGKLYTVTNIGSTKAGGGGSLR